MHSSITEMQQIYQKNYAISPRTMEILKKKNLMQCTSSDQKQTINYSLESNINIINTL